MVGAADMSKPYYTIFYLVYEGKNPKFINCYVDEATEYGGWASSNGLNKMHVPEPSVLATGKSYGQSRLVEGIVKAHRIKRCEANKLVKKWGYDFQFTS